MQVVLTFHEWLVSETAHRSTLSWKYFITLKSPILETCPIGNKDDILEQAQKADVNRRKGHNINGKAVSRISTSDVDVPDTKKGPSRQFLPIPTNLCSQCLPAHGGQPGKEQPVYLQINQMFWLELKVYFWHFHGRVQKLVLTSDSLKTRRSQCANETFQ